MQEYYPHSSKTSNVYMNTICVHQHTKDAENH